MNLKIYRSSAGSGKTFTLVAEYLKLVLTKPEDYRSILAITFTNKAAGEMKSRIISALVSLTKEEDNALRYKLIDELPDIDLKKNAGIALKNILHDYSSFSVSTIDSFFQRILRALGRELQIPVNMEVKVELDEAILEVTDRLLKEMGVDEELTDWLTTLALQKMDDEKGWHLESGIASVARQLFREDLSEYQAQSRETIHAYYRKLIASKSAFESKMKQFGTKALKLMDLHGLEPADFSYGLNGIGGYFVKLSAAKDPDGFEFTSRTLDALESSEAWASKKSSNRQAIIDLVDAHLLPLLQEIHSVLEKEYPDYLTATEVLRKLYLFGIVNDIRKKLSDYRSENNLMLLSDTSQLLGNLIEDSDAPFIYEKTGNRFKHLLIDEFQDTSTMQWKNLLPLIINALGSGFNTLVVGDAKQSIYRWRGGDMNLLLRQLAIDLRQFKSMMKEEVLSMNYRSKREIVSFNNEFFTAAPSLLNSHGPLTDSPAIHLAYGKDLEQEPFGKNVKGGYVQVQFLETEKDSEEEDAHWKQKSLELMYGHIQDALTRNFEYKDICILVRRNTEGNEVANWLFDQGIQEIISPDSLLLKASPRISFLINVFSFLLNHDDAIARSELLYYYRRYIEGNEPAEWHDVFEDHKRKIGKQGKKTPRQETLFEGLEQNLFNRVLPEKFTAYLSYLVKLPLVELGEQIIDIFGLNQTPDAYIQRFQDVLIGYASGYSSNLEEFIDWWTNSGEAEKISVIIPENTNAIRIMSVHRSKGLQFPIVMLPFCEWSLMPKANETLWMKTEKTPYEELGMVAVSSGKRLEKTLFAGQYLEEVNQTILDNLNVLYVAFTRAEEELYACCLSVKEKKKPPVNTVNTTSKLIKSVLRELGGIDGEVFERGVKAAKPTGKDKAVAPRYLEKYPVSRWQEKLTLATHSTELLSLLEDGISRINYGLLMHTVLAEIDSVDAIPRAIEKIVFDGLVGEEEATQLKEQIAGILAVQEIAMYFEPGWQVKAEKEIILPGGEILRPDRVLIRDNKAVVVDFKSGKKEKSHAAQVTRYAQVIKEMGIESVEAKLIYLKDQEVVDVPLEEITT